MEDRHRTQSASGLRQKHQGQKNALNRSERRARRVTGFAVCLRAATRYVCWAMRKRRFFLLLIAGGVLVVVAAVVFAPSREREPEYGGKRLSEWVMAPSRAPRLK